MMPTPIVVVFVVFAVVVMAVIVTTWLLCRRSGSATTFSGRRTALNVTTAVEVRPEFPPAGLLVPEDVLRSANSTSAATWDALEAAAVPVAIEYYPVSASDIAKFRTVPVNAAAQQAMIDIVKALNPKNPTLFRVVLPKGADLVKAVGTSGSEVFPAPAAKQCMPF